MKDLNIKRLLDDMTDIPSSDDDLCPADEELVSLALGDAEKESIREHAETCPSCRETMEQIRADLAWIEKRRASNEERLAAGISRKRITLSSLTKKAAEALAKSLADLVSGVGRALTVPALQPAMAYRDLGELPAEVIGAGGNVEEPTIFKVIKSTIDKEGRITVNLVTTDMRFRGRAPSGYNLLVELRTSEADVLVGESAIEPNGQGQIRARLGSDVPLQADVAEIPPEMIRLLVRKAG